MSSSLSIFERSGRMGSTEASVPTSWEDSQSDRRPRPQTTSIMESLSGTLDGSDNTFLMLDFWKHGVPLLKIRQPESSRIETEDRAQTITLGSGLTSTVTQYTMTEDDLDSTLAGRIVALKTFRRTTTSKEARKALNDCIVRELELLCHPLIVGHPNIVQLYFIGWREGDASPALAMEYGAHGSLEYLIRGSWTGLSEMQIRQTRQHITIDILMGLCAVHKAGFVHGDLKPENILVMSHPDENRHVVAKLTDFGGSSQLAGRKGGRPHHYTPLWCAPEVLNRDPDVDWEKADVYSYGLIVGSLWAGVPGRGGFAVGRLRDSKFLSCFLGAYIPSGFSKEEVETFLWSLKSQDDETDDNSIIGLLRQKLKAAVPEEDHKEQLVDFLGPTLRTHFWLRPSAEELGQYLQTGASHWHLGRDIWQEMKTTLDSHVKDSVESKSFGPFATNWSRNYMPIFAEQAALAMKDQTLQDQNLDFPYDLPETFSSEMHPGEYLLEIAQILDKLMVKNTSGGNASNMRDDYYEIFIKGYRVYLLAMTSLKDSQSPSTLLERFNDLIWTSAAAGCNEAIEFAIFALHGTHKGMRLPIRCLLSLLALSQSNRASQMLHDLWPAHYKMVQVIMEKVPLACEESKAAFKSSPFMENTVIACITKLDSQTTLTLKQAMDLGLALVIREALDGAVVPGDFYESVAGLLHGLSNLPDSRAAALASDAHRRGAKLHFLAELAVSSAEDDEAAEAGSSTPRKLSPLSAAIRRGKSELALAIFGLHVEHGGEPIVDFDQAFALSCVYLQPKIADKLLRLYRSSPQMCREGDKDSHISEAILTEYLLDLVSTSVGSEHLDVRMLHGHGYDSAHEQTLRVLLENGANPVDDFGGSSALLLSLADDNLTAIKLFIEALEKKGIDPLVHLKDVDSEYQGANALSACIECNSIHTFQYLLEKYPFQSWDEGKSESVRTSLHRACGKLGGTPYVETLLRHGADCTALNQEGLTAIAGALCHGHLETADVILSHRSPETLRELQYHDPESGKSIFYYLLCAWHTKRRPELIESFRWLINNGGAQQYGPDACPSWVYLFGHSRLTTDVEQRLDVALLTLFLNNDKLSSGLSVEKWNGGTILHFAVRGGHVHMVRLLLDKGIDHSVRWEYTGLLSEFPVEFFDSQTSRMIHTLDLAWTGTTGKSTPSEVAQNGYLEVQKWFDNMEEIITLLIEKGARSSMMEQVVAWESEMAREGQGVPDIFYNRFQEHTAATEGSWPRPLVDKPTSTSVDTLEALKEAMSTGQGLENRIYDIHRPVIQYMLMKRRREAEKESESMDYLLDTKSRAYLLRHGWRLPPDWYCLFIAHDKAENGGCRALYANRETGKYTLEKPELYRGEHKVRDDETEEKGENIEEEDIYDASPEMKPQPNPDAPTLPDIGSLCLERPQSPPDSELSGIQHHSDQLPSSSKTSDSSSSETTTSSNDSPSAEVTGAVEEFFLLQLPADYNTITYEDGSSVLHLAAVFGNLHILSQVLEQDAIEIDWERHDGCTALHAAIDANKVDAVALLMAYGADPNRSFPDRGYRPIHHSALQGSADMANVLVHGGTDVTATTVAGDTPLHFCVAAGGRSDILETLIRAGADVNAVGSEGSVLKMAVDSRCETAVDMLLNAGACPDAEENLLHAAAAGGSTSITEALLDQGLDVDQRDSSAQTPLIAAVVNRHVDVINLLCERGACKRVIKEFQFFMRLKDEGNIDRMALHVGGEGRVSAEEFNSTGIDGQGWEKWEPVELKMEETEAT